MLNKDNSYTLLVRRDGQAPEPELIGSHFIRTKGRPVKNTDFARSFRDALDQAFDTRFPISSIEGMDSRDEVIRANSLDFMTPDIPNPFRPDNPFLPKAVRFDEFDTYRIAHPWVPPGARLATTVVPIDDETECLSAMPWKTILSRTSGKNRGIASAWEIGMDEQRNAERILEAEARQLIAWSAGRVFEAILIETDKEESREVASFGPYYADKDDLDIDEAVAMGVVDDLPRGWESLVRIVTNAGDLIYQPGDAVPARPSEPEPTPAGDSPEDRLFNAVIANDAQLVETLLLDEVVDINHQHPNYDHWTPLMFAVSVNRNPKLVSVLLEQGASTTAGNSLEHDGEQAPLFPLAQAAVMHESDDGDASISVISNMIIRHTPAKDLNTQNADGRSAMILAIDSLLSQTAEKIMDAGGDPYLTDDSGQSAHSMAEDLGMQDFIDAVDRKAEESLLRVEPASTRSINEKGMSL